MHKPWLDLHSNLTRIILDVPWLVEVLHCVSGFGPPGAYVAAGAIRNTVWDALHGRVPETPRGDVDVVYFASGERSPEHAARLRRALPQYDWEVTNQALVHEWQSAELGRRVAPYASLGDALRVWPETATSVAVAFTVAPALDVVAPHGLADLFAMRVRPSPDLLERRHYSNRVESKGWSRRWPLVTVEP
jgi:hypothetical protein